MKHYGSLPYTYQLIEGANSWGKISFGGNEVPL